GGSMSTAEHILDQIADDEAAFLRSLELDTMPAPGTPELDVAIDRALDVIRQAREEIAKNNEVAARRIQMIEDWRETENVTRQDRGPWAGRTIHSRAMGYDLGKMRSRVLPSGTCGFRKAPDRRGMQDADKALGFADRTAPLAGGIKVTHTIPRTPLKQW